MSERETIDRRPELRPYGSRVDLVLGGGNRFGFEAQTALLVHDNLIVTLTPRSDLAETDQHFTASVEGFATAGEAESAGLRFALAVLWSAVSLNCPLRLQYHTPLPCVVYDRTQSGGLRFVDEARASRIVGATGVASALGAAFRGEREVDRKLLVSMELFAAARLEVTERARFIGLVSSLEPMVNQERLGTSSVALVDRWVAEVSEAGIASDESTSLRGRLLELRRESVSQAVRRVVREALPGDYQAVVTVRDAYDIRSKILHEGGTDADLGEQSRAVEAVLRRMYASRLALELAVPAV